MTLNLPDFSGLLSSLLGFFSTGKPMLTGASCVGILCGVSGFLLSDWSAIVGLIAGFGALAGAIVLAIFFPFVAGILTGLGNAIGSLISAAGEIILSLSKSPEGRITLAAGVAVIGFLFIRYHYFEEGRAAGRLEVKPQIVKVAAKCPLPKPVMRKVSHGHG